MALPEQVCELGAETPLGPLAHDLELRAQKIGLEAGHEALGQLPQTAAALGQFLPLIGREKMEHRRVLGRRRTVAEVKRRHHRRPGIDVRRQESRSLRERVDERALAGLDLADDGDAAAALVKLIARRFQKRRCVLAQQVAQTFDQRQQAQPAFLQPRADRLVVLCRIAQQCRFSDRRQHRRPCFKPHACPHSHPRRVTGSRRLPSALSSDTCPGREAALSTCWKDRQRQEGCHLEDIGQRHQLIAVNRDGAAG